MSIYRRIAAPGGTFFFTIVTFQRQKILIEPQSRQILREVIDDVRVTYPFNIRAWVLLPDHIHCLWTLPPEDANFSQRWGLIKAKFTKRIKDLSHNSTWQTASRIKHRESVIWQRRFWEHIIRDENDFQKHFDYIHYNPVKHGLVDSARDWPYSTFHRYVREGIYPEDWGVAVSLEPTGTFGE